MVTKAEMFDNNTGEVTVGSMAEARVFKFSYADARLIVTDDFGSTICDRSLREENGEEKNDIEAFGIAIEEVGGYFD